MITDNHETKIEHTPLSVRTPVLKVIGLGGGGTNAINRMIELGLSGVDYIAANTDAQALQRSLAPTKIQLGPQLTRGLGAGGDPRIGEGAAEESAKELSKALAGADMVFLTAGMGGGTGTGAIATAAHIAKAQGAVTIATVTTPFSFEVGRRQKNALNGLARLQPYTDTLITVPNDRLLKIAPKDLSLELAFRLADDVLRQSIQGITELITQPGLINIDFAHIRHMLRSGGGAILSIGYGHGPNKTYDAVEQALHHPLLDTIPVENATGIIANFTGGSDLSFIEVSEAMMHLQRQSSPDTDIIPGVVNDARMQGRVQVILIITGLGATPLNLNLDRRTVPAQATQPAAVSTGNQQIRQPEMASPSSNLDMPAFIRRRIQ